MSNDLIFLKSLQGKEKNVAIKKGPTNGLYNIINLFDGWYIKIFLLCNNVAGVSCSSSSAGVISGGGQLIGNFGYGAVTMENKFRVSIISY